MNGEQIIYARFKEIVRQYYAREATVEQLAERHQVTPEGIRRIIRDFDRLGADA